MAGSRFKEKHSLDSDEEDKEELVLQPPKIERDALDDDDDDNYDEPSGEEDDTIEHEGGISITPFNLREEMEEGQFIGGHYVRSKDKEEIKDGWMDNIDWVQVKRDQAGKRTGDARKKQGAGNGNEDDEGGGATNSGDEQVDREQVYTQMLRLMRPTETVARALKRLGCTKKLPASQRWKAKRRQAARDQSKTDEEGESRDVEAGESANSGPEDKDQTDFLKLTGLADELVMDGDSEIYHDTYEHIELTLKRLIESERDALGMYTGAAAVVGAESTSVTERGGPRPQSSHQSPAPTENRLTGTKHSQEVDEDSSELPAKKVRFSGNAYPQQHLPSTEATQEVSSSSNEPACIKSTDAADTFVHPPGHDPILKNVNLDASKLQGDPAGSAQTQAENGSAQPVMLDPEQQRVLTMFHTAAVKKTGYETEGQPAANSNEAGSRSSTQQANPLDDVNIFG